MTLQELISEPEKIQKMIKPIGYCIVSCKVTGGEPVGFMYREHPDEDEDSGWRFMSGTETDEYLEEEENSKVVDVNIIANLDPAIVPYLRGKFGCELERQVDGDTVTFS